MTMRSRVSMLIACTACLGVVHCVSDEPSVGVVGNGDGGGASDEGSVLGDGGGSTDDAAPTTIDVDGTLVFPSTDNAPTTTPLPNRAVVVLDANGVLTKMTSGTDGTFHVASVKTPYDLFIPFDSPDAGSTNKPIYIGGLTRHDPTIFGFPFGADVAPHSSAISYTATVASTSYMWISAGSSNQKQAGTGASHVYNTFAYQWEGPSATSTATVGFLLVDNTDTFTQFGSLGMQTFTDGTPEIYSSPTMATLDANKVVTITATPPGGYAIDSSFANFITADGTNLGSTTKSTATAALNVPPLTSTQVYLESDVTGTGSSFASAHVTYADYTTVPSSQAFTIPAAQVPLTPANGATGVKSTDKMTWTDATTPGYELLITSGSTLLFIGFLSDAELDFAKLQTMGFTLASGQSYNWVVAKTFAGTSNDLAQPGGVPPDATGVIGYKTTSVGMTFTAQ